LVLKVLSGNQKAGPILRQALHKDGGQATAALPHRPSESEPQSSDANDVFLLMVKNSFQLQTGSYQRSVLNKSKDL
jgi:hypothetical protein